MNLRRSNSAGVGVVELAVVIPMLLMFVFVAIEFSRIRNLGHQLTSVSRELGSAVFRDCPKKPTDGDTQSCIQDIVDRFDDRIESLFPGIVMIVSIYRWSDPVLASPPYPPPPPFHAFQSAIVAKPVLDTGGQPNAARSKVSAATFIPDNADPPANKLAALLKGHSVLVHAEVFYRYSPLDSTIHGMFGFQGKEFYVDTAY